MNYERERRMNKRETVLAWLDDENRPDYIPAAFFLHFDPSCRQGRPAIDKHLEFFRYTGMDFVKIQYEQPLTPATELRRPEDWIKAPRYSREFFEPPVQVVRGLVKEAKHNALIIMTLYSPFMWARHWAGNGKLAVHLKENPQAVAKGLEIMTANVLALVRECKQAGVDGFYASSQGGEAFRFPDTDLFRKYIKPTDLAVWEEIRSCAFNILHICDYAGGYNDLTPFLDYPGQVINCSLHLGQRRLSPLELSKMFGRPFMGGMDRKGVLAAGSVPEIQQAVKTVLSRIPDKFILAADCTVASETPWLNLKTAIEVAHDYRKV
jgi:uroporphyrinogen decarboxylase